MFAEEFREQGNIEAVRGGGAEEAAAGQEHSAGGDADGTDVATLVVALAKAQTAGGEHVEIGGLDFRLPQAWMVFQV